MSGFEKAAFYCIVRVIEGGNFCLFSAVFRDGSRDARRTQAGVGFLERGQRAQGSGRSSPVGVRAEAPAETDYVLLL